jgi:prophage regulatory protein
VPVQLSETTPVSISAILPAEGYVRLPQIIGDPKATPPRPAVIPVSKSTWWEGCKTGRYPAPIKLSPRVTVWHVDAIRKLIESGSQI